MILELLQYYHSYYLSTIEIADSWARPETSAEEISQAAKDKPHIRSQYSQSMDMKAKYELRTGKKKKIQSFKQLM